MKIPKFILIRKLTACIIEKISITYDKSQTVFGDLDIKSKTENKGDERKKNEKLARKHIPLSSTCL